MMKRNTNFFLSAQSAQSGRSRQSGSAMVTAVILCFIMGSLSLTYLNLAHSEHQASLRSTTYASCLNLAEAGVEIAIDQVNQQIDSTGSVTFPLDNILAQPLLEDGSLKGYTNYQAYWNSPDFTSFVIHATGNIQAENNTIEPVSKHVVVELQREKQLYGSGFASYFTIILLGNKPILDSYNSKYGKYNEEMNEAGKSQLFGIDGFINKNDNIVVASALEVDEGEDITSITIANADIYGYVATTENARVYINKNGKVSSYSDFIHDESRVAGNFNGVFPIVTEPTEPADYAYKSLNTVGMVVRGSSDPDNPTIYDIGSINLSPRRGGVITIVGHVVLRVDDGISIAGKGGLVLDPNTETSLKVYTSGNIDIAGNGVVNGSGVPANLSFFGTADLGADGKPTQDIKIAGNGALYATVHAPNAGVQIKGGGSTDGDVMGGVVAYSIVLAGNTSFHFDEALLDIVDTNIYYSIGKWYEVQNQNQALKVLNDLGVASPSSEVVDDS